MKQILIILGLFASVTTFAQSPRIKLNQITKDTVKGSVLISSPSDSGMVYSRDFYIAYGLTDTVLILYGDTLAATSGIISSVLSDGVTITGNGTSGNELKVDTSLIATIKALNDSLATVSASTTPDNVTITGDGSVGNPLKVDTLLISTIKGLNDTLTNRGYLSVAQLTDTLDANTRGFLTSEVDGSVSNEGSLTVGAGTASTSVISSNTSGSTDVTLTAGSNITLSETGNNITIAATGGGTSYNNISETADTVFITGDLNVDANTLRVDATNNRVGIGTSSPSYPLTVGTKDASDYSLQSIGKWRQDIDNATIEFWNTAGTTRSGYFQGHASLGFYFWYHKNAPMYFATYDTTRMTILGNGNVGIGTSSPINPLTVNGNLSILDDGTDFTDNNIYIHPSTQTTSGTNNSEFSFFVAGPGSSSNAQGSYFVMRGNTFNRFSGQRGHIGFYAGSGLTSPTSLDGTIVFNTNGGSLKVEYDGDVVMTDNAYINGTTLVTSDFNLKNNINDYNVGLDKILNLRPVSFYLNNDKDNILNFGFIAQDVQEILPELVRRNNNTSSLYLNYDNFIPILVNAIKEQQAIIETQEQKITDLQTTIQALITRIEILENK